MDLKFVKYEKKDHLAFVTFNRPERMNTMHPPTSRWTACGTISSRTNRRGSRSSRAPATRAFRPATIALASGESRPSRRSDESATAAGLPESPRATTSYKPIIAAVNGFALGGGCEIALACDIIIAAEHARFGLPEPRVGLMAGAGGVHRLPRHIPLKIALGMMMTGRHITAAEAHRWGLVNEVVPFKDLIPTAERWAAEIMECSPLSIQATKEAAYQGLHMSLEEANKTNFPATKKLFTSKDLIEGPRAFAEKRKPNWKGE